jgi:hypothetical protein
MDALCLSSLTGVKASLADSRNVIAGKEWKDATLPPSGTQRGEAMVNRRFRSQNLWPCSRAIMPLKIRAGTRPHSVWPYMLWAGLARELLRGEGDILIRGRPPVFKSRLVNGDASPLRRMAAVNHRCVHVRRSART